MNAYRETSDRMESHAGKPGTMSALGLRADRTAISFHNITEDLVRVEVRVSNDGDFVSPPTDIALQSAGFGAFLPWHPLMSLSVPALAPRTSLVVAGTAMVPPTKSAVPNTLSWSMPPDLLREFAETTAREAREEAEREARRLVRRAPPILAADSFAVTGREGVHWTGNIDILMRDIAAERHLAGALRVYPGRTNAAMFYVGDRPDGYKFELSGDVEDWKAEIIDMSAMMSPKVTPAAKTVPTGGFREFSRGTFYMLVRPPRDAEKGYVSAHVTRQSDGREVVVEFNLDRRAKGAGCYTV